MTKNYLSTGVPAVPSSPMVTPQGTPTLDWYSFFVNLWNRTGGSTANISPLLDQISSAPGELLYRAPAAWAGLGVGTNSQVLKVTASFPQWGFLDGSNFNSQSQNSFFAGPAASSGIPVFRALATADLNSVAGAIPGSTAGVAATPGNVGEILSKIVASGAAVSLTNGTTADVINLTLTAGDWDVWGTLALITTSTTAISAWINTASVTDPGAPNSGAYVLTQPPAALTANQVFPIGTLVVEIGSTTHVYLSANVTFGGAASVYGALIARRRR